MAQGAGETVGLDFPENYEILVKAILPRLTRPRIAEKWGFGQSLDRWGNCKNCFLGRLFSCRNLCMQNYFHADCLHARLFPCKIVFSQDCFHAELSSCKIVSMQDCFHSRLSSCKIVFLQIVFMQDCFHARLFSCKIVFMQNCLHARLFSCRLSSCKIIQTLRAFRLASRGLGGLEAKWLRGRVKLWASIFLKITKY